MRKCPMTESLERQDGEWEMALTQRFLPCPPVPGEWPMRILQGCQGQAAALQTSCKYLKLCLSKIKVIIFWCKAILLPLFSLSLSLSFSLSHTHTNTHTHSVSIQMTTSLKFQSHFLSSLSLTLYILRLSYTLLLNITIPIDTFLVYRVYCLSSGLFW